MDVESGMSSRPGLDPRVFVGCVIVHDQMQIEMGRRLGVDLVEETNKFLVSMSAMQSPITLPSSMLRAANSVVVPLRL